MVRDIDADRGARIGIDTGTERIVREEGIEVEVPSGEKRSIEVEVLGDGGQRGRTGKPDEMVDTDDQDHQIAETMGIGEIEDETSVRLWKVLPNGLEIMQNTNPMCKP